MSTKMPKWLCHKTVHAVKLAAVQKPTVNPADGTIPLFEPPAPKRVGSGETTMDDHEIERRMQDFVTVACEVTGRPVMLAVRGRRNLLTARTSGLTPVDKVKLATLFLRDAVRSMGDHDPENTAWMLKIAQELEAFIGSGPPARITTIVDDTIRPWTEAS